MVLERLPLFMKLLISPYGLDGFSIFFFLMSYLITFKTVIPSGEALDLLGHVEAGRQVLNPNHLFIEPITYWLTVWGNCIGQDECGLQQLKIISGVSTILSLMIFHSVLCQLYVSVLIRFFSVIGLLASKNFFSMAVSEEFFMIQMPFLMMTLWLLVTALNHQHTERKQLIY